nr:protein kinase-like domain, concanavalin A-like lectin/glucanase domain protein [Tanacetum cinerariifolium]
MILEDLGNIIDSSLSEVALEKPFAQASKLVYDESLWLIRCFVYVVDFMILEDLGNIIDSSLSEVALEKPFAQASKLVYDESLWLIRFAHRDDEVVFRMPQRTT